jgi:hypothetical protein
VLADADERQVAFSSVERVRVASVVPAGSVVAAVVFVRSGAVVSSGGLTATVTSSAAESAPSLAERRSR